MCGIYYIYYIYLFLYLFFYVPIPRLLAALVEWIGWIESIYVYFDFESGWCQRIKTEFTFEYAFLEDDLKSIASSAPPAANGAAPPKGAATTGSTVTPS